MMPYESEPLYGFNQLVRMDSFTQFSKALVLISSILVLILSMEWLGSPTHQKFEYPVLILLSVVGCMIMISANDLLTLYVGLELTSLALYILASFERDDTRSNEAGLKYFVLGALASGMMLYGSSLIYGFAGSTNFSALAELFSSQSGGSACSARRPSSTR
jgi:NADH-quinone oxidoreductase subunit N